MALLRAWRTASRWPAGALPDQSGRRRRGRADGDLGTGLTSACLRWRRLEAARDHALVSRLLYLSELRGLLNQYASGGEEQLRHSQAELMGVENSLKVMRGMHRALADPAVFELSAQEQALGTMSPPIRSASAIRRRLERLPAPRPPI